MALAPDFGQYLPSNRIQFAGLELADWRSAIRLTGAPLVRDGIVTAGYPEAAISLAEQKGPYFDLGHGIAMPHARPEAGAHGVGLAVLRCSTPVLLLGRVDHPIAVFIMLAAPDSASHLELLRQLAEVLANPARRARLTSAAQPVDIRAAFAA